MISHFNLESWPPCLGLPGFPCCHGNTDRDLPRGEKKKGRKKKGKKRQKSEKGSSVQGTMFNPH